MPDIGWMELLVIGIVALIVVGPKDLPIMFRRAGQFTGRIRAMARDFQRAMDEAADESGMTELNRDLRNAARYTKNPAKAGRDALKDAFGDIDPTKFPEGSHTRAAAEKRNAEAKAAREKTDTLRAAREDGTADENGAPASPAAAAAATPAGATPQPEPATQEQAPARPRTGTEGS
ncbi:Sec-independent protein translocase protein TatB [Roseibacterium sp. SDUM158017]|uniref:Sec-independent protein translocase protein TatB n=1 Tax=Roseicyclus salinarum TaxID=3036773 RepID=UPI0024152943|nr:Sec-independent protein translocase protein TatB [Roseibacterium sp. SDUM158017]MDG4649296.1 Sec-independent protein translocase protein TatB [Roseibacterium sp. SDUM158017]